jgi:uncharacterized membrane protein
MVTVFALAAALLYGSSDFLGGAATRRAHVLSVLGVSATTGAVVAMAAALLIPGPASAAGLVWGACAGVAGALGLMLFYAGLAAGPMSVVSPVSALVATVLPVGAALAVGERPGLRVYMGSVACIAATLLVSRGGTGSKDGAENGAGRARAALLGGAARGVCYGIAAGVAFGVFFLFIRNGGQAGGLWPIAVARLAGTLIVLAVAVAARVGPVTWHSGGGLFLAAVGAGAGDVGANVCYVLATRAGLFGLAVVLTSLYPGVTVLLARLVLGERVGWARGAGLALAIAGILLVIT